MPRTTALTLAVIVATTALVAAGLLWIAGVGLVQGDLCPPGSKERSLVGLDTPRSAWPPGVTCTERSPGGERTEQVVQIFDGLTTVIVGLVAVAVATLLLAIGVTLVRMRRDEPFAAGAARRIG